MRKPLRWGVLGCARVFQKRMIPAFTASANNVLYGLASRDYGKAQSIAEIHGIPLVFDSYTALLRCPDIDAVYIPLPNDLHAQYAMLALDQGKHVLCDKPFTLSAADAIACSQRAAANGLRLMEGFMYRHHPQHAFVKCLVATGVIGKLQRLDATFCYPAPVDSAGIRWNASQGGGALWDVGVYGINAARLYLGEPAGAYAQAMLHQPTGVDTHTTIMLDFLDGAHAIVHCGFDQAFSSTVTLSGTTGLVLIERAFQVGEAGTRVAFRADGSDEIMYQTFDYANQWSLELDDFEESVHRADGTLVIGEDGVLQAKVMDAVLASLVSSSREVIAL